MAITIINQFTKFLKDVRNELRKVIWPTQKDVVISTIVVIVAVVIVGIYISFLDVSLTYILTKIGFLKGGS